MLSKTGGGRRRASTTVTVTTALAALSLSLSACGSDPSEDSSAPSVTADCVVQQPDGSYKAVDDDYCDDDDNDRDSFVWIYGGSSSHNGHIYGGTRQRPSNTNITSRSGKVIVGGFGGTSKGDGGS
ncbi:hypothetical protein [Nonomuraea sp. NPDC049400]|uniref:hypothetical protein n=1 Tax=Nonomuraea sp. NPDC049400 TaxID=3364352 RepID=UPI00378CC73E